MDYSKGRIKILSVKLSKCTCKLLLIKDHNFCLCSQINATEYSVTHVYKYHLSLILIVIPFNIRKYKPYTIVI